MLNENFKYEPVFVSTQYALWREDQDFMSLNELADYTLVDFYKCFGIWQLAKQQKDVEGCYLEVGVYKGGTATLISKAANIYAPDKNIYLADTFEGVVKVSEIDSHYSGGEHSEPITTVESLMEKYEIKNYKILKGIFPDDTGFEIKEPIALLHSDCDVYDSTKDIVEWAIPRMSKGGIIVFDDYGFQSCPGVTQYVNEISQSKDFLFIYNLNGHGLLIKR
jgi:O-methyltransferase